MSPKKRSRLHAALQAAADDNPAGPSFAAAEAAGAPAAQPHAASAPAVAAPPPPAPAAAAAAQAAAEAELNSQRALHGTLLALRPPKPAHPFEPSPVPRLERGAGDRYWELPPLTSWWCFRHPSKLELPPDGVIRPEHVTASGQPLAEALMLDVFAPLYGLGFRV